MTYKKAKELGLQKCKYLDDLGIKTEDYFTNFCDNTDTRYPAWVKEKERYGFDNRETWCLDKILVEWIYTRFKMYKEIASNFINLTFYKFPYTNDAGEVTEVTQIEAIDLVLDWCENTYFDKDFIDKEFFPENLWSLIGKIMPAMWW